jgi:cobalt-precorrin-5B (C1)-methyltransferase
LAFEEYVMVAGKKLRKGYTTGSCAAAAAKAAVQMLVTGKPLTSIAIDTPAGIRLDLPVGDCYCDATLTKCSVVKDGGDDPDVTNGLKICAEACYTGGTGITVAAGEGIGTVTQPGLKVPPGRPAINPVPMQMIVKEATEAFRLAPGNPPSGVKVTLSVPDGMMAAQRTFNPKLGVVGGISILGSKGIEEPMSKEALKESLALELSLLAHRGMKQAAFVFGNYGESFASEHLNLSRQVLVKVGNEIGFMLEKAVEYQFEAILIIGHIGKLVKVAAGIFQTHSRVADARAEILCAYAALEGAAPAVLNEIYRCRTAEAATAIIRGNGLSGVLDRIGANAARRCREYLWEQLRIGVVLYANDAALLYQDREARELIEELKL